MDLNDISATVLWRRLDEMEEAARLRIGGCRYLCVRCRQAYALLCLNPACRRTAWAWGNRERARRSDADLARAIRAERQEKRAAANRSVERRISDLWAQTVEAVRLYRTTHPARATCVAEIPYATEIHDAHYIHPDPHSDPSLPHRLDIAWRAVRVTMSDGTYADTTATRIDIPRVA